MRTSFFKVFGLQRGKSAAFLQEKSSYKGDMKEADYRNAKKATKVVGGLGSAAWVFGGKNESTIGGIAAVGSGVANSALGNGYQLEMRFKCM